MFISAVKDLSKPEQTEVAAESLQDISDDSAQLVCAVIFGVAAVRNLSKKKHLAPAAKILQVKSRGQGKYDLAKRLAIALVQKRFVEIQSPVNYRDLEIFCSSSLSSGSTASVDCTDSSLSDEEQ